MIGLPLPAAVLPALGVPASGRHLALLITDKSVSAMGRPDRSLQT